MIAGSFIGAEFTSGSISNWLSFVPRRIPVFVSKLFTIIMFSALAHGIGYWVAVVGVLAVVTGLVFRRRDVT